jgi:hypothetical protein
MGVPSSASLRRLRRLRQHVSGGTPAAATHTDMVTKTNGVFGPCAAADASSTSASPLPSGLDRYIAHSGDRSNEVMLAHTVARALPKTELHLHLDGSITADFICRAAARRGITVPPAAQLPRHIDELRAVSYRARPQVCPAPAAAIPPHTTPMGVRCVYAERQDAGGREELGNFRLDESVPAVGMGAGGGCVYADGVARRRQRPLRGGDSQFLCGGKAKPQHVTGVNGRMCGGWERRCASARSCTARRA